MTESGMLITVILTVFLSTVFAIMGARFMINDKQGVEEAQIKWLVARREDDRNEINRLKKQVADMDYELRREIGSWEQKSGVMGLDHGWRQPHKAAQDTVNKGRRQTKRNPY